MKLKIAEKSGFCFGVKRAVNIALDVSLKSKERVYTFGPIIHNPQVLSVFKKRGVEVLDKVPSKKKGIVIIRAHGIPPSEYKELEKTGLKIVDATCPKVIKVQQIIDKFSNKGYSIIVLGNAKHPEVKGLLGFVKNGSYVVSSLKDFQALPKLKKAIVVAQTTQNFSLYKEIEEYASQENLDYKFFNTICDATEKRQKETDELSKKADLVLIIGGKASGNTKRLYDIAKSNQVNSYHIEDVKELDVEKIRGAKNIFITAGASTPSWVIKYVVKFIYGVSSQKGIFNFFLKIQKFLLKSSIYLSIGAGSLTYAFCKLQGINNSAKYSVISFCYVFFMHILKDFNDINSHTYNNPEKALFFSKHKKILLFFLSLALVISIVTSITISYKVLLILVVMTSFIFVYKVFPKFNIPASKTIEITTIWAVLTTILPAISSNNEVNFNIKTFIAFFCSICLVFARTTFFDMIDMQGDKIAGKETLPTLIGKSRSFIIINIVLILTLLTLFISTYFSVIPIVGYYLSISPIFLMVVFLSYNKKKLYDTFVPEFLVESNFILAGVITFIEFFLGNTKLFMV